MSREKVKRKICFNSSVGNVSASDGGFEADMSCVMTLYVRDATQHSDMQIVAECKRLYDTRRQGQRIDASLYIMGWK